LDNLENSLNIAIKTRLGDTQIKNTVAVSSDDNIKIAKVLTASAKPRIENIVVENLQVKFDGVIDYDFLVVLENNELMPLSQKSNFALNYESEKITPNTCICIDSVVAELNNITNTEVVYSSLVNFIIYSTDANNDISLPIAEEGVFVKDGEISYTSIVDCVTYDGRVDFELIKDSKTNKILFVTSSAVLKSLLPSNNYFVASGEVFSTVVYENEDGVIKCLSKECSFSEEIEAQGVTKESNIQAQIITKETVVVENIEKNLFSFDVPIQICAQVFAPQTKGCIVDAYSLKSQINLTTTSFVKNEFLTTRECQENIITNFVLDDKNQNIDKILAVVPNNILIINQIIRDNTLVIEGIASINIIYYYQDEEGSDNLNSIDVEIPYSLEVNVDELTESDRVVSQIIISDISAKNKMGKELEILSNVRLNYSIIKESISAVITNIETGEDKPQKDYALEIYVSHDNQSLWDIAKQLNVSSTDLIRQNGELVLPIKAGEKIVSYTQRVVDCD